MSHLRLYPYGVGDYVTVAPSSKSSGGVGWIKSIDGSIDVEYVVPKKTSKNVGGSSVLK